MRGIVLSLMLGLAGLSLMSGPGFSQSAAERRQALEQQQNEQRQKALDRERKAEEAALAHMAKRKACRQEAKAQGLSIFKRRTFMKECMAR
ncbi:MAG: hypothetical protein JO254_11690 [Pseudolabrys sp.]|nr:hypothetical protein [Pseudolabrys sp.]